MDQDFLAEQEVEPWMGPRALPLWLPLPEYAGLMAHDVHASYDAGLATRPIGDTARDTLAWLREHPDAASPASPARTRPRCSRAWHARAGADSPRRTCPRRCGGRPFVVDYPDKPQPNRSIAFTTVS